MRSGEARDPEFAGHVLPIFAGTKLPAGLGGGRCEMESRLGLRGVLMRKRCGNSKRKRQRFSRFQKFKSEYRLLLQASDAN